MTQWDQGNKACNEVEDLFGVGQNSSIEEEAVKVGVSFGKSRHSVVQKRSRIFLGGHGQGGRIGLPVPWRVQTSAFIW